MEIDIHTLQTSSQPMLGNTSGVYFLFQENELVYIGQGWNCILRVAEHTRKDSEKIFSHWNFIAIESEYERKQVEKELLKIYAPKFNKQLVQ